MRKLPSGLLLVVLAIALVACSSGSDSTPQTVHQVTPDSPITDETLYTLDWNIPTGEVVAYRTAMTPVEDEGMTLDTEQLAELAEGEINEIGAEIVDVLAQLLDAMQMPQSSSLISLLELNPTTGNIDVRMIFDTIEMPEPDPENPASEGMTAMMEAMVGTVQLRGAVSPDGAITSFYLPSEQKNLLAIFFELPTSPVRVGDSWEIDVDCLSLGAGFVAENAQRLNQVTLTEISQIDDGRPVAVLDYLILEMVSGQWVSSSTDETSSASSSCSFIGGGLFLIDEGRWALFNGEMSISASGVFSSNGTQQFALIPTDDVPQEYLDLE